MTGYYRRDNHGFRSEVDDFKLVAGRLAGPTAAVWANTLTGNAAGLELTLDRRAVNGDLGMGVVRIRPRAHARLADW